MSSSIEDQSVISEELWRTWDYKNKVLRRKATARKKRIAAAIAFALVTIAIAIYAVVLR